MKLLWTLFILLTIMEAKIVITPTVGKQVTTPSEDFKDDEVMLGVGIQSYLDDNFAVDMRIESSDSNLMADGGRTDLERGSVNLLYDFTPKKRFSPYLIGGIGYEKLHRTYLDIKSQSFYHAGGGLKVNLSDRLEFMTEVRYLKKADTKDDEVIATCGLGVKFGTDECEVSCDTIDKALKNTTRKNPITTLPKAPVTKKVEVAKPAVKAISSDKSSSVVFSDEVVASKYLLKKKEPKTKIRYKSVKTVTKGDYIQVAALSQRQNLIKTVKKLKQRGLRVKTLKKGEVTVVLVGPYPKPKIDKVLRTVKTFQKDAFYKKL